MALSLIVAMSTNGVIGRDNQLPWRIPADLRRFKRITMGHHLIMGRRTYESIGRPLPGRTSIVVSREEDLRISQVTVAHSLEQALDLSADAEERFVIGGGQIYQLALPLADRIYQTLVHAHITGDVSFPEIDWSRWMLVEDEFHKSDARNEYDYSFRILRPRGL